MILNLFYIDLSHLAFGTYASRLMATTMKYPWTSYVRVHPCELNTLCLKLLDKWLILLCFNGKNVDKNEL